MLTEYITSVYLKSDLFKATITLCNFFILQIKRSIIQFYQLTKGHSGKHAFSGSCGPGDMTFITTT